MRYAITKFITFSPQNVSEDVFWALGAIYAGLVFITILSVFSLRDTIVSKLVWTLLVICVPVLGVVCHCFRCLLNADYQFLKQFGLNSSKRVSPFTHLSYPTKSNS